MTYHQLTKDELKAADTYMPIMQKQQFVNDAVLNCFNTLKITAPSLSDKGNDAIPDMFKADSFTMSRYLMGALLKYYFHFDVDTVGDDKWLITADEYDRYAGGHFFEQLNRFKSDVPLRDKAFDILADFKDLQYRLEREVQGMLAAMNDNVGRASAWLSFSLTPEDMQNMLSDLDKSQAELQEYINSKQAEENG